MSAWDDETKVERLLKLWAEGLSASQIGAVLGVTRNSVIAKIDRLRRKMGAKGPAARGSFANLGPRGRAARSAAARAVQSEKVRAARQARLAKAGPVPVLLPAPAPKLKPVKPWVDPPELDAIPEGQRKNLADLESGDCRWPIGDPRHAEFHFCARPAFPGLAYCVRHARQAFAVPAKNADTYAKGVFLGADGQIIGGGQSETQKSQPAAGGASEREMEEA